MSLDLIRDVQEHSRARGLDRFVLVAYAWFARRGQRTAYPPVAAVAEFVGASERRVQSALRRLQAEGELAAVAHARGGRGRATEYEVLPGLERAQTGSPFPGGERVQDRAERVQDRSKRVQTSAPHRVSPHYTELLPCAASEGRAADGGGGSGILLSVDDRGTGGLA